MSGPNIQKRFTQFRGPSDSADYNLRIEETYRDLLNLVNRAENTDIDIESFFRATIKNNLSMQTVVEDLKSRIQTLESSINRLTFHSASQVDTEAFDSDATFAVAEEDALTYDGRHGLLTLPKIEQSSMSKMVFLNAAGREVKPDSINIRVVGDEGTADSPSAVVDSSPPEYALFGDPGLVWERNVIVNSPNSNGARMTIYAAVPTDLFTTENANAVVVDAFPSFGCTIESVEITTIPDPFLRESDGYTPINYQGYYAGEDAAVGWVAPGGWTGGSAGQDKATTVGPRAFYFRPAAVTAVKVVLHQSQYYRKDSSYVYSYGLAHLDLRYDKFLPTGKAMIRFDAPPGDTISSVNSVQAQIWNVSPAILPSLFSYRLIWETSPGSNTYTLSSQPNSSRVWIEVTLENRDRWNPALSGIIIDYS